jgi:uncharacterized membrane protein HdeD (DUF308 family)
MFDDATLDRAGKTLYTLASVFGVAAGLIFLVHAWKNRGEPSQRGSILWFSIMSILQQVLQIIYLRDKLFALVKIGSYVAIYAVCIGLSLL